jgi:Ni,Fe-hydrogenase III large subunit
VVRGQEVHEVGVGPDPRQRDRARPLPLHVPRRAVQHLEIQLGYQHRGVEALLLRGRRWR